MTRELFRLRQKTKIQGMEIEKYQKSINVKQTLLDAQKKCNNNIIT